MNATWTQEDAQKAITEIVRRASIEPDFRRIALSDPAKAIQMVSGKPIPPGMTVKFFDGSGAVVSVVLPPLRSEVSELTDQELEQVAGGRCGMSCVLSCAVSSTATGPVVCP